MTGKQRILLLVLLLFGLPAIVTTSFLTTNIQRDVHAGAQPGGVVRGKVSSEGDQALADIEVVAFVVRADGARAQLATTRSDATGAFQLTLPAVQGRYELRFTGQEWQEARIEHGWLDADGRRVEPPPLQVRLRAGASLDVDLVRPDGRAGGAGAYELEGSPGGGFFSGWTDARVTRRGSFTNGSFSVEGLPPMRGRLHVRMASGERFDAELDLGRGKNRHKIEVSP